MKKNLVARGFNADSIHGNKSQNQRDRAIKAFREGSIRVLVATDVAARGIDIPGVGYVYNYDLPNVSENYVHRIGRTARAEAEGTAIAFCSAEEMSDLRGIEKLMKADIPVAGGVPWSREEIPPKKGRGKSGGQKRPGQGARRPRRGNRSRKAA